MVAHGPQPVFLVSTTLASDEKYNAFPSLAVTPLGQLLAVYREGSEHISDDGKVTLQASSDGGATWGSKAYIASPPAGHDYRDPSIVCTATGRLIVTFFDGPNGTATTEVSYITSDDGGATWTTPCGITVYTGHTATSGNVLQHSTGALLWPVYGQNSGDTADRCGVLISTDDGDTWSGVVAISAPNASLNELSFVEMPDRSVRAFVRRDGSIPQDIYVAKSVDIGRTWTTPNGLGWSVYPGRPTALLMPGSQALILFYRSTKRAKTAYQWSFTRGSSWSGEHIYSPRIGLYAGATPLGEHLAGVVVSEEITEDKANVVFSSMEVVPTYAHPTSPRGSTSSIHWAEGVRVRQGCDDDRTLGRLEPGRDLLLEIPRRWGEALPDGVLLDDWLSPDARRSLDDEALAALVAWQETRPQQLTVDGICLPEIWEQELLAEVFLPETRVISGLRAVLSTAPVRRIELEGFDELRLQSLRDLARELGIEVTVSGGPAAAPTYPTVLAAPWRVPLTVRTAKTVLGATGVPRRTRGSVYVLGYWHLVPVVEALARMGTHRPVLDPWHLPRLRSRALIRAMLTGGWIGRASALSRARSRRRVAAAVAAARASSGGTDPLGRLLDARALSMLEQRAGDTLALVACMRAAFASRRIRVAVLPYDSPPAARSIAKAAQENNVPTLVVQHGFYNEPNDGDKTVADLVAVWSERDVADLAGRARGAVTCTGNPGIAQPDLLLQHRREESLGRTVVLVEYSSRLSTRIDDRVSMRHVSAALRALATTRPGTVVTIRPHPAEHEPEIFAHLASAHPEIEVKIDTKTPIGTLFAASDLCVAAVSTATLEAAAAGVPVIVLNVTGSPARAPFDGSSGVPVATTSERLAELIPAALASEDVSGRSEMLDALGVRPDAVDQVVELIQTLAAQAH